MNFQINLMSLHRKIRIDYYNQQSRCLTETFFAAAVPLCSHFARFPQLRDQPFFIDDAAFQAETNLMFLLTCMKR